MSRPVVIDDDQILNAAREVFLEKGFGASTAEISRRAHVSEGSLFRRYATKQDLFFAAMGPPGDLPWFATLERMSGKGKLKSNLVELGVEMIEDVRAILPRLSMFWAARVSPPPDFHKSENFPPMKMKRKLAEFFACEIELGRMRKCDPDLAGAVFMGGIQSLAMGEMMGNQTKVPARRYAETMVDFLWRAFAPAGSR